MMVRLEIPLQAAAIPLQVVEVLPQAEVIPEQIQEPMQELILELIPELAITVL